MKTMSESTLKVLVMATILYATGCTPAPEGIDAVEKQAAMSSNSVFDATTAPHYEDVPDVDDTLPPNPTPTPAPTATPSNIPDQPDATPTPVPTPTPTPKPTPVTGEFGVRNLCSDMRTTNTKSNVKMSSALEVQIVDLKTGQALCKHSLGVREALINEKKLRFPICKDLKDNLYGISVIDNSRKSQTLLYDHGLGNGKMALFLQRRSAEGPWVLWDSQLTEKQCWPGENCDKKKAPPAHPVYVIYDKNPWGKKQETDCDLSASPLVVDTGLDPKQSKGIQLSAPLDGVKFDILGDRALPVAHTKNQISWVHNPNYMFIVKPNAKGEVNGIDELFGDNTKGTDGKYSTDGFAALAKWDGKDRSGKIQRNAADHVIDRRDEVFYELRLWSDINKDGVAQSHELYRLTDVGVEKIDLLYDPNYSETDKYGNKILYKSVVKYADGKLRLVFDVWFRLP